MKKLSRRDFLRGIGFVGLSSLFQQKEPEHKIYLPNVSSCGTGDYVKLGEDSVPVGHIGTGFPFYDFPQYPKYILEANLRTLKAVSWVPYLRFNDDTENNYVYTSQSDLIFSDRFQFMNTVMYGDFDYPYTMKIEINNISKMYSTIRAFGTCFSGTKTVSKMITFQLDGVWTKRDPIEKIVLFSNFPTAHFNADSVARLYGVR